MIRTINVLILLATLASSSACNSESVLPTPSPNPSATLTPTSTPVPTPIPLPTHANIRLETTTPILPSPIPSRTPTRVPTRIPATTVATRIAQPTLIWDPRLDVLGVRVEFVPVQSGQRHWRLIRAEFWDEKENQGKHHIFVNVLDETGARVVDQEILVEWPGEKHVIVTEDKPPPEYSANFPLNVNHYPPWGTLGVFNVQVKGLPSDKVIGMGLPPKNKLVVYLLTFQHSVGEK